MSYSRIGEPTTSHHRLGGHPLGHLHDVHPFGLFSPKTESRVEGGTRRSNRAVIVAVTLLTSAVAMELIAVSIATTTIRSELETSLADVQWVVGIYALAYAVMLLPAGRLVDRLGPRRVWIAGCSIYTLGVLSSMLAPDVQVLIGSRFLAGIGAGLLSPSGYALIGAVVDRKSRGKVVGRLSSIVLASSVLGPMIGGILIELFGWRSLFALGLGLAVAGGATMIRGSKVVSTLHPEVRLAPFSALLLAFAVGGLSFAMIDSRELSLFPAITVALSISLLAAVAFWLIERREERPYIDFSIFRNRRVSAAVVANFVVSFAFFGNLFYLLIYLQTAGGLTAATAGLVLLPGTLIGVAASPMIGRVADRWRAELMLPIGLAVVALSLFLLALLDSESSVALHVLPGLILNALGFALVSVPAKLLSINAVPESKIGGVSSLISFGGKLATGMGVAASSVLFHLFSGGNVEQSLQSRGATVEEGLFNALVSRCLGRVDIHHHLERVTSIDNSANTPGIGELARVLEDGLLFTLNDLYLAAGIAVTVGTLLVALMLRPHRS